MLARMNCAALLPVWTIALLLFTHGSAKGVVIGTFSSCQVIGLQIDEERGIALPVFQWELVDVVLSSQQLNDHLGGALAAVGIRTPPDFSGQTFGGPCASVLSAVTPPGWTAITDPNLLPFRDQDLVPGQFLYFIPPQAMNKPENLGTFRFRTVDANFDSLILEARGADFTVGESGLLPDFGPILINPPVDSLECIPEPSGATLSAIGVLGLFVYVWKTRREQRILRH